MTRTLKISLLVSVATVGACQTMETPTPEFGTAVRHNIAMQTVEPTAEQKQNTYIRPNSQRMATARERYKNDDVEEPAELTTTGD